MTWKVSADQTDRVLSHNLYLSDRLPGNNAPQGAGCVRIDHVPHARGAREAQSSPAFNDLRKYSDNRRTSEKSNGGRDPRTLSGPFCSSGCPGNVLLLELVKRKLSIPGHLHRDRHRHALQRRHLPLRGHCPRLARGDQCWSLA